MRILASSLSFLLFFQGTLFAYSAESNFWKERRLALLPRASFPVPTPFDQGTGHKIQGPLSEFGTVRSKSNLKSLISNSGYKTQPVIFHIQDVHLNKEAQDNIGRIFQWLMDEKKVDLVALEGAFHQIPIEPFRSFPDKNAVKRVADYLYREGKISGAVHAAYLSPRPLPPVIGVDDAVHYKANVNAYLQSVPQQDRRLRELDKALLRLDERKKETFNRRLWTFDRRVQRFRNGHLTLGDFIGFLRQFRPDTPLSINVELFDQALSLETSLDFEEVDRERTLFLNALLPRLAPSQLTALHVAGLSFQRKATSPADFYRLLWRLATETNLILTRYPEMTDYLRYLRLSDQIDAEKLLDAAQTIEQNVYDSLVQTDEEKALVRASRRLYLTGKLIRFELTKTEWEEYKRTKPEARDSKQIRKPNVEFRPFERFYEETEARDKAMADNLLAAMKTYHAKTAILVTGGFHRKGIASILEHRNSEFDSGLSVISFVPRISKIGASTAPGHEGSSYLSAFTQEKTPLDRIFEGNQLSVTPLVSVTVESFLDLLRLSVRWTVGTARLSLRIGSRIWTLLFNKKTGEILRVSFKPALLAASLAGIIVWTVKSAGVPAGFAFSAWAALSHQNAFIALVGALTIGSVFSPELLKELKRIKKSLTDKQPLFNVRLSEFINGDPGALNELLENTSDIVDFYRRLLERLQTLAPRPNEAPPVAFQTTNSVRTSALSHDGTLIGIVREGSAEKSAFAGSSVYVYHTNKEAVGGPFHHPEKIEALAFSPDNGRLYFSDSNGTLYSMDRNSLSGKTDVVAEKLGQIRSIAVSLNGQTIAAGNTNKQLWILGERNNDPKRIVVGGDIHSISLGPAGQKIAVGGGSSLLLYELGEGTPSRRPLSDNALHNYFLTAFSPDEKNPLVAGLEGRFGPIRIWNIEKKTEQQLRRSDFEPSWSENGRYESLAFSRDGTILAASAGRGKVEFWDVDKGELIRTISTDSGANSTIGFDEKNRFIAVNEEGTVHVWESRQWNGNPTERPVYVAFEPSTYALDQVENAVSRDGHDGLPAPDPNPLERYGLGNSIPHSIQKYGDRILAHAVNPEGTVVAAATQRGVIYLWNAETRKIMNPPIRLAHEHYTAAEMTFSNDPQNPHLKIKTNKTTEIIRLRPPVRGSAQLRWVKRLLRGKFNSHPFFKGFVSAVLDGFHFAVFILAIDSNPVGFPPPEYLIPFTAALFFLAHEKEDRTAGVFLLGLSLSLIYLSARLTFPSSPILSFRIVLTGLLLHTVFDGILFYRRLKGEKTKISNGIRTRTPSVRLAKLNSAGVSYEPQPPSASNPWRFSAFFAPAATGFVPHASWLQILVATALLATAVANSQNPDEAHPSEERPYPDLDLIFTIKSLEKKYNSLQNDEERMKFFLDHLSAENPSPKDLNKAGYRKEYLRHKTDRYRWAKAWLIQLLLFEFLHPEDDRLSSNRWELFLSIQKEKKTNAANSVELKKLYDQHRIFDDLKHSQEWVVYTRWSSLEGVRRFVRDYRLYQSNQTVVTKYEGRYGSNTQGRNLYAKAGLPSKYVNFLLVFRVPSFFFESHTQPDRKKRALPVMGWSRLPLGDREDYRHLHQEEKEGDLAEIPFRFLEPKITRLQAQLGRVNGYISAREIYEFTALMGEIQDPRKIDPLFVRSSVYPSIDRPIPDRVSDTAFLSLRAGERSENNSKAAPQPPDSLLPIYTRTHYTSRADFRRTFLNRLKRILPRQSAEKELNPAADDDDPDFDMSRFLFSIFLGGLVVYWFQLPWETVFVGPIAVSLGSRFLPAKRTRPLNRNEFETLIDEIRLHPERLKKKFEPIAFSFKVRNQNVYKKAGITIGNSLPGDVEGTIQEDDQFGLVLNMIKGYTEKNGQTAWTWRRLRYSSDTQGFTNVLLTSLPDLLPFLLREKLAQTKPILGKNELCYLVDLCVNLPDPKTGLSGIHQVRAEFQAKGRYLFNLNRRKTKKKVSIRMEPDSQGRIEGRLIFDPKKGPLLDLVKVTSQIEKNRRLVLADLIKTNRQKKSQKAAPSPTSPPHSPFYIDRLLPPDLSKQKNVDRTTIENLSTYLNHVILRNGGEPITISRIVTDFGHSVTKETARTMLVTKRFRKLDTNRYLAPVLVKTENGTMATETDRNALKTAPTGVEPDFSHGMAETRFSHWLDEIKENKFPPLYSVNSLEIEDHFRGKLPLPKIEKALLNAGFRSAAKNHEFVLPGIDRQPKNGSFDSAARHELLFFFIALGKAAAFNPGPLGWIAIGVVTISFIIVAVFGRKIKNIIRKNKDRKREIDRLNRERAETVEVRINELADLISRREEKNISGRLTAKEMKKILLIAFSIQNNHDQLKPHHGTVLSESFRNLILPPLIKFQFGQFIAQILLEGPSEPVRQKISEDIGVALNSWGPIRKRDSLLQLSLNDDDLRRLKDDEKDYELDYLAYCFLSTILGRRAKKPVYSRIRIRPETGPRKGKATVAKMAPLTVFVMAALLDRSGILPALVMTGILFGMVAARRGPKKKPPVEKKGLRKEMAADLLIHRETIEMYLEFISALSNQRLSDDNEEEFQRLLFRAIDFYNKFLNPVSKSGDRGRREAIKSHFRSAIGFIQEKTIPEGENDNPFLTVSRLAMQDYDFYDKRKKKLIQNRLAVAPKFDPYTVKGKFEFLQGTLANIDIFGFTIASRKVGDRSLLYLWDVFRSVDHILDTEYTYRLQMGAVTDNLNSLAANIQNDPREATRLIEKTQSLLSTGRLVSKKLASNALSVTGATNARRHADLARLALGVARRQAALRENEIENIIEAVERIRLRDLRDYNEKRIDDINRQIKDLSEGFKQRRDHLFLSSIENLQNYSHEFKEPDFYRLDELIQLLKDTYRDRRIARTKGNWNTAAHKETAGFKALAYLEKLGETAGVIDRFMAAYRKRFKTHRLTGMDEPEAKERAFHETFPTFGRAGDKWLWLVLYRAAFVPLRIDAPKDGKRKGQKRKRIQNPLFEALGDLIELIHVDERDEILSRTTWIHLKPKTRQFIRSLPQGTRLTALGKEDQLALIETVRRDNSTQKTPVSGDDILDFVRLRTRNRPGEEIQPKRNHNWAFPLTTIGAAGTTGGFVTTPDLVALVVFSVLMARFVLAAFPSSRFHLVTRYRGKEDLDDVLRAARRFRHAPSITVWVPSETEGKIVENALRHAVGPPIRHVRVQSETLFSGSTLHLSALKRNLPVFLRQNPGNILLYFETPLELDDDLPNPYSDIRAVQIWIRNRLWTKNMILSIREWGLLRQAAGALAAGRSA